MTAIWRKVELGVSYKERDLHDTRMVVAED